MHYEYFEDLDAFRKEEKEASLLNKLREEKRKEKKWLSDNHKNRMLLEK